MESPHRFGQFQPIRTRQQLIQISRRLLAETHRILPWRGISARSSYQLLFSSGAAAQEAGPSFYHSFSADRRPEAPRVYQLFQLSIYRTDSKKRELVAALITAKRIRLNITQGQV